MSADKHDGYVIAELKKEAKRSDKEIGISTLPLAEA
jgi:hypothetical protein